MPPRPTLQPIGGRAQLLALTIRGRRQPVCLFCSASWSSQQRARKPSKRRAVWSRQRAESTTAATTTPIAEDGNSRKKLQEALVELQKHAGSYVNLSRIQLALRGLQQEPGRESVRVAILSLASNPTGASAKTLLRLLLADPLKAQDGWEAQVENHDTTQPLIVRIGGTSHPQPNTLELAKNGFIPELSVSSASLNGNDIEMLFMEVNPPTAADGQEAGVLQAFEEAVLVPTIEIPTSNTGRYTPVTTPVHKAIIVADGILGATSAAAMPLLQQDRDQIIAAVNLDIQPDDAAGCPFVTFNAESGAQAIEVFRQGVENAMQFQSLWSKSNVSGLLEWVKQGSQTTTDGTTKQSVRTLIASVLRNTLANIQAAEAKRLSHVLASRTSTAGFALLNKGLADWAEAAHAELQEQLDLAFSSRRWRKLSWWKLFWRVDDVTMLSSELVTLRFLPGAEQEVIYLAGRIEQARLSASTKQPLYSLPAVTSSPADGNGNAAPATNLTAPTEGARSGTKWPTHIPFTKRYLLDETIPALQALAQKLVLQTVSTSALTSSLAALMYLSSFGAYESGAVGALGLVWSLGRMQKKWETAREFWEGEAREEGRKAVRATEASVAEVLDRSKDLPGEVESLADIRQARELVLRAQDALEKLK